MRLRWHFVSVLVPVVLLFAGGCDDSKKPLSDAKTSKADQRLVGVWRQATPGGTVYYHIGQAGKQFPASVMRVVQVTQNQGSVAPPNEYLAFPTVLGDKTYLNVVWGGRVKVLDAKGWNADEVDSYTFVKYRVDGDKLAMWIVNEKAKKQAIDGGKVKGVAEANKPATFTGTTEEVARFVAEAGDSLFPGQPTLLVRVDASKDP